MNVKTYEGVGDDGNHEKNWYTVAVQGLSVLDGDFRGNVEIVPSLIPFEEERGVVSLCWAFSPTVRCRGRGRGGQPQNVVVVVVEWKVHILQFELSAWEEMSKFSFDSQSIGC